MVELRNIVPLSLSGNTTGQRSRRLEADDSEVLPRLGRLNATRGRALGYQLPSLWDQADIGESALKGPLPLHHDQGSRFEKVDRDLFKDELKRRSTAASAPTRKFVG
jgi:hypothetical protein